MRARSNSFDRLIGRNIRFYRRRRGVSQSILASVIHVTYQQVQKYERGGRIAARTLWIIACFLRIPFTRFFEKHPK